jgi:hypothetical protein
MNSAFCGLSPRSAVSRSYIEIASTTRRARCACSSVFRSPLALDRQSTSNALATSGFPHRRRQLPGIGADGEPAESPCHGETKIFDIPRFTAFVTDTCGHRDRATSNPAVGAELIRSNPRQNLLPCPRTRSLRGAAGAVTARDVIDRSSKHAGESRAAEVLDLAPSRYTVYLHRRRRVWKASSRFCRSRQSARSRKN